MVHSRHRYLNLTSDLDTDDLIDKRWSVTSTSNFQKVWNWSLNSWFLRIELTVTFDRLTLFHLIDGIWNIPKLKIIGRTGLNRFEQPSVDSWPDGQSKSRSQNYGPDRGPDFWAIFRFRNAKKSAHILRWWIHHLSKVFIQPIFMVFSSFSRFEILKTTFWYFNMVPPFRNSRYCFKVHFRPKIHGPKKSLDFSFLFRS